MPELFDTKYWRGQGAMFIGTRSAAGEPEKFIFAGDLGEALLEPSIERTEVIENVTGQGGIGSTTLKSAQYDLKMMMRSVKSQHLALALQGTATAIAGASVANQSVVAWPGKFLKLQHVKVSAVVVTGAGGTPVYTAGVDYVLNAAMGLIEILPGVTIVDGQLLEVDYTFAAQNHLNTNPANTDYSIMFAGKNTANNDKQTRVEIYKVRLDPTVPPLITEEEAEFPLTGRVLLDSLRPAGDQFFKWKIED